MPTRRRSSAWPTRPTRRPTTPPTPRPSPRSSPPSSATSKFRTSRGNGVPNRYPIFSSRPWLARAVDDVRRGRGEGPELEGGEVGLGVDAPPERAQLVVAATAAERAEQLEGRRLQ